MKKILILFCAFILSLGSVLALSYPRWEVRPIKVYIPGNSYTSKIMKNAFLQWQTRTKSAVLFTFLNDARQNEADITVHFVETNTYCGDAAAIGCTRMSTKPNGFFVHNDIYIAYKFVQDYVNPNGVVTKKIYPIPAPQLYRVMLHETGHAIGINTHSTNPKSIMYTYSLEDTNTKEVPQRLTQDDINFVTRIYR